jgi:hypothetical protein
LITWIRIAGIAMNALGALVLAWRVKGILDILVLTQHANDVNFRVITEILNGKEQELPLTFGMNEQVEKQQRRGIKLLVFGFLLISAGNILVGLSWYFGS